jgi:hypothetical protein
MIEESEDGAFGKLAKGKVDLLLSDASTVANLALQAGRLVHRNTLTKG